jgi:hypothetical protein
MACMEDLPIKDHLEEGLEDCQEEEDHLEDHLEEEAHQEGHQCQCHQHQQFPAAPHDSKLVGNLPIIFKGEKSQAEEFITQWELYKGVNINNTLMRNAYQELCYSSLIFKDLLLTNGSKGSMHG